MKIIGFKCAKASISWAVIEGAQRCDATVLERKVVPAPNDIREAQLAWVSKEVRSLLEEFHPTRCAIQAAGGSQGGLSDATVQRIEIEGVVRSVLGLYAIPTKSIKPQSVAKAFGVRKDDIDALLAEIPCVTNTPKTYQEPVVLAVSQLPA